MSGETPLMAAAGRGNVETVRVLLAGGAKPNTQESMGGQTALMWAVAKHQNAVVDELVKNGADVNLASKTGFTPLMFAAQQGDAASVHILIGAGAKVDEAQPKTGLTPLLIASAMVQTKAVDALLDGGANPNIVDSDGYAPLHRAVRDSDYGMDFERKDAQLAIVKSLLKHGANPNLRIKQDKAKAADEIKKGSGVALKRRAALTVTEILLQGSTPLLLAAETSNLDLVKALVDGGADPNIPTETGSTPLIMAAGAGTDVQRAREPEERAESAQTLRYLVEHGADVNKAGQFGWTALHAAAYQGINDDIEYLVSKGAKIDQKDNFGQTALSISLSVLTKEIGARRLQIPRRYREDTAKLLLKLGATPLDKSGVNVVLQRSGDEKLGVSKQ
jgi:ankyrin repeat protein